MKFVAVLTFVLLIASAFAFSEISRDLWNIDWSRVVPRSALNHKGNLIDPKFKFTQDVGSRIWNGVEVTRNSHPYAIYFLVHYTELSVPCQGALISERTMITTASCLFGSLGTTVIAGAHDITSAFEPTQQRIEVFPSEYRIHPVYNPDQPFNNIATVLSCPWCTQLALNQYVQPVQVAPRNLVGESLAGEWATFVAWGTHGAIIGGPLRSASNTIRPNPDCQLYFNSFTGAHLCFGTTGDIDPPRGPCTNDEGGPLTITRAGQRLLVGLYDSKPSQTCDMGFPTKFTRITGFLDWIDANTI